MTSMGGNRKGYGSAKGNDVTRALVIHAVQRTNGAVKSGNSHLNLRVVAHPYIVSTKSAGAVDIGKKSQINETGGRFKPSFNG
jgi:hypothetical protein